MSVNNTVSTILSAAALATVTLGSAPALATDYVKLQFSDGRKDVVGLESVNAVLRAVGVRASTIDIPANVKPTLAQLQTRASTEEEQKELIAAFSMNRAQLLEQIELAGRTPEQHRGGFLGTREGDTAPYPKVYDMMALSPDVHAQVLNRYGRLHVNTSDNGSGIDEVMTVVSGGPFTWMYVLSEGVVARLTVDKIDPNGKALRLSYPGVQMHAGWMDAKKGLIVAFAHGPESFTIRFNEPSVPHSQLLNNNPWVDFTGETPKIKSKVE